MIIEIPKNIESLIKKVLDTEDPKEIEKFIIEGLSNHISKSIAGKFTLKTIHGALEKYPNAGALKSSTLKDNKEEFILKKQFYQLTSIEKRKLKEMSIQHNLDYQIDSHWPINLQRFFPIKATLRIISKNIAYKAQNDCFLDARRLWETFEKEELLSNYWLTSYSPPYLIKTLYEYLLGKRNNDLLVGKNKKKAVYGFWNPQRSSLKDFWRRIGGSLTNTHELILKSKKLNETRGALLNGHLGQLEFLLFQADPNGNLEIQLTKEGYEFVVLRNPILDCTNKLNIGARDFLSSDEKQWLINHMSNQPTERMVIETILDVFQNFETPVEFKNIVANIDDTFSENSFDKNKALTMSTITRLCEVGILKRTSRGYYELGENRFPVDF